MATVKNFEELEIWQLARQLNKDVYPLLNLLQEGKNFELKGQLDGSAGSVMDNIAEGFERDENKEFIQFLSIAKGSLSEVRSQLNRAFDRGFISEPELNKLNSDCTVLADKIGRFITYLRNPEIKGRKFKHNSEIINPKPETRNN
jgi:four helix bundle protein